MTEDFDLGPQRTDFSSTRAVRLREVLHLNPGDEPGMSLLVVFTDRDGDRDPIFSMGR